LENRPGRPVLIVTCRAGNEGWCEEEVGNILFRKDPDVVVARTKYPGLLVVYSSKLSPEEAYRAALASEYGFVTRIIPVQIRGELGTRVLDSIPSLLERGERVKLKLRVRGVRGMSKHLWKELRRILEEHGVEHDPSSQTCLYVEVIDSEVFIGKGRC